MVVENRLRLFTLCTVFCLLLGFPANKAGADPQSFQSTFNMDALRSLYAMSCDERMQERKRNLLPPEDEETPAIFHLSNSEFMKVSPHLKSTQKSNAAIVFLNLSNHIKDFVYMHGLVYIAPRIVAEARPDLGGDRGFYNDLGLYMTKERRAYIPFTRAKTTSKFANGKFYVTEYVDSPRDRSRMITHETGHAIDDILGHYSRVVYEERRLTERRDFNDAFNRDMNALAMIKNVSSNENIMRRGYYLPVEYRGVYIGGLRDDAKRNRREVFAELWAEINSKSPHKLSEIYPRTYDFVRQVDGLLHDLHDKAPVQCVYTLTGKALTPKK